MFFSPETNVFSTVLDLPPGTHHIKFIIDGDMRLSNDLPTSVDYTNALVNYIEVSADDIPEDYTDDAKTPDTIQVSQPAITMGVETQDHEPGIIDVKASQDKQGDRISTKNVYYGRTVPGYLGDFDRDEKTARCIRAMDHAREMQQPPTLPLFLGKSILNGTTHLKDDSSILATPNHTMLNHLTTSSIKNDVLATSLTTRYKRKVR